MPVVVQQQPKPEVTRDEPMKLNPVSLEKIGENLGGGEIAAKKTIVPTVAKVVPV